METGFVYLDEALSGIRWDAKYATRDNFTGAPVDGYHANRVVGTQALADALRIAQGLAAAQGYGLLLWDGYRPTRAVEHFLRWASQPEDGRAKARYYPNIDRSEMVTKGYIASKSGHSRGSTIDLTLYRLGQATEADALVPMGGGFDLMDERSHHGAAGITEGETQNRSILCTIMVESGFAPFACEWWHYTLRDEPYPDVYFNFPIGS